MARAGIGANSESPGETWLAVEAALSFGLRGFSGSSTLLRLLAAKRGRYHRDDSRFTIEQILAWAHAWHKRTGEWPTKESGTIPHTGGMRWISVELALVNGRGDIPSGSSLGAFAGR